MNRSGVAARLAGVFLISRVLDLLVTRLYSPSLQREANPVASVLGFGWAGLLCANALGSIVVVWAILLWRRRPLTVPAGNAARDYWSFASICYYSKVYPPPTFLIRSLYRMPSEWRGMFHMLGFVGPAVVSCMSVIAALNWMMLDSPTYRNFSRETFPWYPYVGPVFVLYYLFFLIYYSYEWKQWRLRECS